MVCFLQIYMVIYWGKKIPVCVPVKMALMFDLIQPATADGMFHQSMQFISGHLERKHLSKTNQKQRMTTL